MYLVSFVCCCFLVWDSVCIDDVCRVEMGLSMKITLYLFFFVVCGVVMTMDENKKNKKDLYGYCIAVLYIVLEI